MSDQPNNPQPPSGSGSVAGKGWDILVGGKDNVASSGGDDPFDLVKPPFSAVETKASTSRDAEADAILNPRSAAPRPTTPEAIPGAAGVSAGVVVTPVGAPPPADVPSAPPPMPMPAPAASAGILEVATGQPPAPQPMPSAPGVVEIAPPGTAPLAPPPGMVIPAVPAPRIAPAPMNVSISASIPSALGVTPFGPSGFEVSDPFSTQTGVPLFSDVKDIAPNAALESQLVTDKRVDALWDEITQTYNMVVNDVRGHFSTTEQAIEELRKARELILSGKDNFDNAEELVYAVKARLRLEEKVRQWSRTRGVWLVVYLVLWLLLLSLGSTATTKIVDLATTFRLPDWMPETYLPALFGALGGVIGALWVLVTHTTRKRDFDPIHTLWYASNPFMGGALGVVTYFIVRVGAGLAVIAASGAEFKMTPVVAGTLYTLCIVVGFNQNVLWALIDRFIKSVFPQKEEDQKAATDIKPATTTDSGSGDTAAKSLQG